MNDPIYKSPDGRFYRQTVYDVEVLDKNLLRIYDWNMVLDDLPPNCQETTLGAEGFKMVGEAIMKDVPSTILNGDSDDWIEDDTGGFTRAPSTSEYVQKTHSDVAAFDNWIPENDQQRKFKNMVLNLENKARSEEDEYRFTRGENCDF